MFLLNWLSEKREQEKKKTLCENLKRDIKYDIGDHFEENNKDFNISYIRSCGHANIFNLHLHLSETINEARQEEWKRSTGKLLNFDDEDLMAFYKEHYQELEHVISHSFPYAEEIRSHILCTRREDKEPRLHIEYVIQIPIEERIFPMSRKIKKSILKCKDYFLYST